ncbi:MAG: SlyX protein [Bilophila wadsworthia]
MSELLHSPVPSYALKAVSPAWSGWRSRSIFRADAFRLNEAITLQQRQLDDLQGRMEAVEEKFRELWGLSATRRRSDRAPHI